MQLDKDYLDRCPDLMSKEQFRLACRISKRTALYFLQAGLIPHVNTGKGTHKYLIRKNDVRAFARKYKTDPQKYLPPENWYKYSTLNLRQFTGKRTIIPIPDEATMREYYEACLREYMDVLKPGEVADFTGYDRITINRWINSGKLKCLKVGNKFIIPMCYLIDWLCSKQYNSTKATSGRHEEMLREMR